MKTTKLKKWYSMAQVLLCMTPIMFYIQVSYKLIGSNLDLQGLLEQDAAVAISFLAAIINPFIAYQLHNFKKNLKSKETSSILFSLVGLVVAQLLLGNLFYVCILVFLGVQTYRYDKPISFKLGNIIKNKDAQSYFAANAMILALSVLCFYASMQIM